jgi:hypothetical protein
LRDFDLQTRMFKYPLSYMIYSRAFDAMPALVKDRVYQRLYDILTGKDTSPTYACLSPIRAAPFRKSCAIPSRTFLLTTLVDKGELSRLPAD